MRVALPLVIVQCMLLASVGRDASAAEPPVPAGADHSLTSRLSAAPAVESLETANPLAAPAQIDPRDLLFAAPTSLDHIGRIVVAVRIDGQGPFRFIVDTGANYSTISPKLAARLGLAPSTAPAVEVSGITGTAKVPSVPIRKLQAGDLTISDAQFPVVWAPLMAGADGILGVAGLRKYKLLVDFDHDRVVISRHWRYLSPRDFSHVHATRVRGGLIAIDAHVGGVPVLAIIDTGSERTIGNMALHDALYGRRKTSKDVRIADVYGATTAIASGELDTSPLIDLGSIRIGSVTLVFGEFHIFDVWDLERRPALIVGMDVLGTVSALSIDFSHAEIYLDSKYALGLSARTARSCSGAMRAPPEHCSR